MKLEIIPPPVVKGRVLIWKLVFRMDGRRQNWAAYRGTRKSTAHKAVIVIMPEQLTRGHMDVLSPGEGSSVLWWAKCVPGVPDQMFSHMYMLDHVIVHDWAVETVPVC
jgi:hypothetical protein